MLRGQLRFSLLVAALLGGLMASARAQVSPTPLPAGDATTSSPADPSTVPVSPPIAVSPSSTAAAPVASPAAPPSGGDSAPPTELLVKIADAAVMAHCEYLGQESRSSEIAGARGRAQIHAELRKAAADRGASHMRFSDYQDGSTQSEVARFYGCRDPRVDGEPKPAEGGSRSRLPRGALTIFADLLPEPSLSTNVTGTSQQMSGVTAYGLSANLDYFPSPYMSIGLAPRFAMGLHGEGAMSSATQLDLLG